MMQTKTSSTAFAPTTTTLTYLAIDERSGYVVAGATGVQYVRMNDFLVSSYVAEPVRRSSRKERLLADPTRRQAIERARRRIAEAIEDGSEFSLAKLRLRAGLSQAQLATLVGSHQPAIARLEKGEVDPGISTLTKLSEALGVQVEEVLRACIRSRESRKRK